MMESRRPRPVWDSSWFAAGMPETGWIADYVRYAVENTDAPPHYHIAAATTAVASAVAPFIDFVHFGARWPLHLFTLIVGPSSNSRKTSAIRRLARTTEAAFKSMSQMGERLWYLSGGSPEGILTELVKEPNRLVIVPEWTRINGLDKASYWKHHPEFWNEIFDALPIDKPLIKQRVKIDRPRVSLLAASTPSLIRMATSVADWASGKLARYLMVYAERPDDLFMTTETDNVSAAAKLAQDFRRLVGPTMTGPATLSEAAWDLLVAWENGTEWRTFERATPEHLRYSFGRLQGHVFRVSVAFQASIDYPAPVVVTPETMQAAITFVAHAFEELVRIFSSLGEEKTPLGKVEATIREAGADGITKSDLLRNTRILTRDLDSVLSTLINERGDVRVDPIRQPGAGRPGVRYTWTHGAPRK